MAHQSILDLEDLARRYDAQVLREYLLEQELTGSDNDDMVDDARRVAEVVADTELPLNQRLEAHDLKPRCFRRLRLFIVTTFIAFWATVLYGGYAYKLEVEERGPTALPPLEVSLIGVLLLGTQATLELAVSALLTQPSRREGGGGFRCWDILAWFVGIGARATILLDVQVLAVLHSASSLLFVLSLGVFTFAIGFCVFVVQLRLLVGLFWPQDLFAYDKPDLFFKGADACSWRDATRGASMAAASVEDGLTSSEGIFGATDRPPSINAVKLINTMKVVNAAHLCDISMLHAVLVRLYVPIGCQETQEFVVSATSFSRCFCEDVVQCIVKFFFLLDCDFNRLVLVSLLVSATQAFASCAYSSSSSMDIDDSEEVQD